MLWMLWIWSARDGGWSIVPRSKSLSPWSLGREMLGSFPVHHLSIILVRQGISFAE